MKTLIYSSLLSKHRSFLTMLVVMLLSSLCSFTIYAQDQEAYVETDAPDYAPGSTVIIAGEYWTPGEVVYLKVTHLSPLPVPDATGVTPNPYDVWSVIADANGEVHTTWYVNAFEAGAQLQLEAYTDSGYDYRTFFTDAGRIVNTVTTGAQSGAVTFGQSATPTYNVIVNTTGSGNLNGINLSVIGLPSGVTGTFSPASVNASNSNQNPTSTLTLSVPNNINAGTYSFTVRASFPQGASTINVDNTSNTLLVSKANSTTTVTIVGGPFTFNGLAQTPATVSVTGAGGLNLTPAANYSNNVNAGTAIASYTYAGDANHNGSRDSKNFNIGKANATVTVNGFSGIYNAAPHGASGTATGVGGVDLSAGLNLGSTFTNVPGGTANWTFSGGTNYNDQSGSVAININKADATVNVSGTTVTYDANAHGASGTATGVGGVDLSAGLNLGSTFTNVPGGTANWKFTGGTNYNDQSGSVDIKINKADATVNVSGTTVTYDANPHGASGTATGVGGVDLSADLSLGSSFTNVPGGTANWTFTGGTNYNDQSGSVAIIINKADATVNVLGTTVTYDANAHGASGTATGVAGVNLSSGLNLGSTFTNVPGGTANWTFTGGTNYNDQSGSVAININKADATVNVSGTTVTYDAAPHGASGTATGVGGVDLNAGLNLGSTFTNVPGGTANWTFSGGTNYNDQSGSASIIINKADAIVNVSGTTVTYDANAHGASGTTTGVGGVDLSADLNLGSTFTNVPGGTANWTFSGGTNYNDQSGSVAIIINKAAATVNVSGTTVTYDANPHGASGTATGVGGVDLSADLSLGSSFTNVPGGTAHWTFTGGTNYNDQSGSVAIIINKADATVNVSGTTVTYDANAHGASGTATGVGGVDLSAGLNLGSTFTNVPGGTSNWTFTGGTNYNDQSGSVAININKADATVIVSGTTVTYDANAHGASGTATGVGGVDLSAGLNFGSTFTNVPGGTANWTFTGGTNYNDQSGSVAIIINKADAIVNVSGTTVTYDANPHGASGTATGVGGVDLSAGLNLGSTFTNVPGGTANWTFSGGTNYNDQSGSVAIIINKAAATVNVSGTTVTYDANAHGASGTATGVGGVDLSAGLNLGSTFTNVPGGTANWTFTGGTNYNDQSGSVAIIINKADAIVNVSGTTVTYDANPHGASGTATGVGGVDLSADLNLGSTFTNVPGGTANWTFTGGTNYNDQSGSVDIVINKALTTTVITISNATYDGNPHGGTANVTGAGGLNQALTVNYSGVLPTVYGPSTTAPTLAGSYNSTASYAGDANHFGSNDSKNFAINLASTTTTLTLSGAHIRYMDNLTFTAVIVPLNTATPLAGTVEFKVGSVSYGVANVVPVPGASDGSVQAMLIKQIAEMPATYNVTATFTSSNPNYAGSNDSKSLLVGPRTASPYNATGFYTGDGFAWTTSSSTSTATLTMTAVIKDASSPTGDVRGAKVSFYFVNGTTYTAIPSAQNLPVGLIDVTDGSVGAASAIVQLNIGSANAASFQIAIKISGAYTNTMGDALSQTLVTVSKPVAGGYIMGGSNLLNAKSSGYIMGATGLNTDYQFDIQYTKSGTNPKGKATIFVRSYYTKDGILDSKLHTYIISTNAISTLSVGTPLATGTFSAKANLVEQLADLSTVAIEGGSTFQMVAFQNGSNQQIAITLYRKAGGVWYSSNWDKIKASTLLQTVSAGSNVYVAGGGTSSSSASSTISIPKVSAIIVEQSTLASISEVSVKTYPNPFVNRLYFSLQTPEDTHAVLEMFDLTGRKVAVVFDQKIVANQQYDFNYTPANNVAPGMLIYRATVGTKIYQGKVIYQPR